MQASVFTGKVRRMSSLKRSEVLAFLSLRGKGRLYLSGEERQRSGGSEREPNSAVDETRLSELKRKVIVRAK